MLTDTGDHPCLLTPSQSDVLQMLADGYSYKQIALAKDLRRRTVWRHAQAARMRLGAKTIMQAVAMHVLSVQSDNMH
jgi:DNA-binding CsgD family transcriptional regulator